MTGADWVFGYGSLVSPDSIATTIGRPVDREDGYAASSLHGYERRWNYGSLRQRADWDGPHGRVDAGVVVSLGLTAVAEASTNGAVVRVTAHEFEALDRRESDYDRIDVTDRIDLPAGVVASRVYTYLPRPSAIARYESARQHRRAAVKQGYVDLVEEAFAALGAAEIDRYRSTTPVPDVPVVAPERVWLEPLRDLRPRR